MTKHGRLKSLLDRREFVITAEITPQLTADRDEFLQQAKPLKDRADAVNVTDGAGARVAMSSLAAAAMLVQEGIEPVMQMTCRDRNRIAIVADLIGAAALGITNILFLRGDRPEGGDEPDAKAVFDLESNDVITIAQRMRDEGMIPSGREFSCPPNFHIGAADVPFDAPPDWKPDALRAKIDAGADFIQTQFCFEPLTTQRYLERLREFGILDRVPMILGVGPILSARSASWMNENLFGVTIPDSIIRRLEGAKDQAAEGLRICVELIELYKVMPGVSGVHIMAPAQGPQRIADVIDAVMPERLPRGSVPRD